MDLDRFRPLPYPSWMQKFMPVKKFWLLMLVLAIFEVIQNPEEWLHCACAVSIWAAIFTFCFTMMGYNCFDPDADEPSPPISDVLKGWFWTTVDCYGHSLLLLLTYGYSIVRVLWILLWLLKEACVAVYNSKTATTMRSDLASCTHAAKDFFQKHMQHYYARVESTLARNARMEEELARATSKIAVLNERMTELETKRTAQENQPEGDSQQPQQVCIEPERSAAAIRPCQHQLSRAATVSEKAGIRIGHQEPHAASKKESRFYSKALSLVVGTDSKRRADRMPSRQGKPHDASHEIRELQEMVHQLGEKLALADSGDLLKRSKFLEKENFALRRKVEHQRSNNIQVQSRQLGIPQPGQLAQLTAEKEKSKSLQTKLNAETARADAEKTRADDLKTQLENGLTEAEAEDLASEHCKALDDALNWKRGCNKRDEEIRVLNEQLAAASARASAVVHTTSVEVSVQTDDVADESLKAAETSHQAEISALEVRHTKLEAELKKAKNNANSERRALKEECNRYRNDLDQCRKQSERYQRERDQSHEERKKLEGAHTQLKKNFGELDWCRNQDLQKWQRCDQLRMQHEQEVQHLKGLLLQSEAGDDRFALAHQEVLRIQNAANENKKHLEAVVQDRKNEIGVLQQKLRTGETQYKQAKEQAEKAFREQQDANDKARKNAEELFRTGLMREKERLRGQLKQECEEKDSQIQQLQELLRLAQSDLSRNTASSSTAPPNQHETQDLSQLLAEERERHTRTVAEMQRRIDGQAQRIIGLMDENEVLRGRKHNRKNPELEAALGKVHDLETQVETLGDELSSVQRQADELEQEKQRLTNRADVLQMSAEMYRQKANSLASAQPPQQSGEASGSSNGSRQYAAGVKRMVNPDAENSEPENTAKKARPAIEEQAGQMDEDEPEMSKREGKTRAK